MKLSTQWIRDFVDLPVDDRRLAEDLTGIGIAVEGISGTGADAVFEMEIGTNRPDAMNHYGVAREAAALYEVGLRPVLSSEFSVLSKEQNPAAEAISSGGISDGAAASRAPSKLSNNAADVEPFPITVEESGLCPRFSARVIRGTTIKPSAEKIAHRLQLLEQRPISNAVDATNYVLWEMGKPTHVFDMDLLEGGRLIIRKAKNGEKLKTLDGVTRTLTSEDLVVADAVKPVGLAGVMGGYDTMITDKTKNILIESAWWDPGMVRQMSRRHGLHTDASHRFERGADFESTILSCDLVAAMILQSGGGELVGDVIDVVSRQLDLAPIVLRVSEVRRILGGGISGGHIFGILKRLGFVLIPEGQEDAEFRVEIPSWRLDVEREIDLIEEIARLHGYDKFENTLPAYSGAVVDLPNAAVDKAFRERALALGYNEAVSLTFISHGDAERFENTAAAKAAHPSRVETERLEAAPLQGTDAVIQSSARVLELANPLSEEASVMRSSLAPGMLDMLAWNLNRDSESVRLFEMGRVYEMRGGERVEPEWACLAATGSAVSSSIPAEAVIDASKSKSPPKPKEGWDGAPASSSSASSSSSWTAEAFRAFKGDVENLLSAFELGELSFDRETAEYFHPERSARVLADGVVVGQFGQVADAVKAGRKLRQDVFLAEIDLDVVHARGLRSVRFAAIGKYPAVERDFSFVFADDVEFAAMLGAVKNLRIAELREFEPVEIFRGGAVATGKYSILLRARLQSAEGTLRDEQIGQWSGKIVDALQELGGVQRALRAP